MDSSKTLKLELGCGKTPTQGYIHHDRIVHADHIDVAWDLTMLPWPFVPRYLSSEIHGLGVVQGYGLAPGAVHPKFNIDALPSAFLDEILALDVFEHVFAEIQPWLDECWRLLKPDGLLDIRLPAYSNHLSYRDPTHLRVFHPQTFSYWDPSCDLHRDFGSIYFAESNKWWKIVSVIWENNDLRYKLTKRGPDEHAGSNNAANSIAAGNSTGDSHEDRADRTDAGEAVPINPA